MTGFERLKEICRSAAHERNACKEGFADLMQTKSVGGIMQVWKDNWDDVYESKYADIMVREIADVYAELHDDFRRSGVYVNEDSDMGLVIVSNPDNPIQVGGTAKVYVFTDAEVTATDNAQVYCRADGAHIILKGHAYGNMKAGMVEVTDFAEAKGSGRFHTFNAAEVAVSSGKVIDHGHRRIAAYGGTRVYSDATRGIELGGQSRQYPLNEYNPDEP